MIYLISEVNRQFFQDYTREVLSSQLSVKERECQFLSLRNTQISIARPDRTFRTIRAPNPWISQFMKPRNAERLFLRFQICVMFRWEGLLFIFAVLKSTEAKVYLYLFLLFCFSSSLLFFFFAYCLFHNHDLSQRSEINFTSYRD